MKKLSILLLTAIALQGFSQEKPKNKKPNIILILADDMGYSDLGSYGSPKNGGAYELYDIDADRGENNDLADQYPEIVADLKAKYDNWAKDNGVVDYDKLKPQPQKRTLNTTKRGF